MAKRYTYRSSMGDYGSAIDWEDQWQEIYALRNKVGMYEDNEWNDVREKGNPKISGRYFVTYENQDGDRYTNIRYYYRDEDEWCNLVSSLKVIAWHNLLRPYKEGENEKY